MKFLAAWLVFLLAIPVGASPDKPDGARMLAHVRVLAQQIGVRRGGSPAERKAADYIATQLQGYGYTVTRQSVPLPGGRSTLNVVADKPGLRPYIVGAHIDSKPPSPGGNDNATGVAVTLELARLLKDSKKPLRFLFFGCEEVIDGDSDHHHFGSRHYVAQLSQADLEQIPGMICIDSVGAGPHFVIGTLIDASDLSRTLRQRAQSLGYAVEDMVDPGWSDHEAFHHAGVETAYVRWRVDPTLHGRGDNVAHVSMAKMMVAARTVLSFLSR